MKEYNEEETLDSLLDALVTYSKFYNKAYSKESLVHDLPIEKGKENPELFSLNSSKGLFSRAAANAG